MAKDTLPAAARFVQWMTDAEFRAVDLGTELEVHPSYVSHIRAGRRLPSRRVANLIERLSATWSRGPIRAMEWDLDQETGAA